MASTHDEGPSLRPVSKYKFRQSSIRQSKPKRAKKWHGRGGGLRGKRYR